jgi:hypothetical protein
MNWHRTGTAGLARLGRATILGATAAIAFAATSARGQTPSPAPAAPAAEATAPAPGAAAAPATTSSTETATTVVVLPAAAPPAAEKSHRELAGHLFMPSHLIQDPFSVTSFGSYFGLGAGNAVGPVLDPGPPPAITANSKWYGYTGLAQEFDLNVRIIEYLSLRLFLGAGAFQGTGSGSALVVGTNVRLTGDLELKGSLPLGEHVRLALSLGAAYGPVFNVLILEGVVDAINACRADPANCTVDAGNFLQESDTTTWKGTLSFAWAPFPFLGVMANAGYLNPRQTSTGKASLSQNGLRLGGALEFDAKPLVSWLPIGVSLVYDILSPVGGIGIATAQNMGFGFYYTGRKDLSLGLEIDWRSGRLESSLVSEATLAWVNFRYYW